MTASDDLRRENRSLRERLAALNTAILRINASLDLDTVLGEAVKSARSLTGARYGIITTLDEEGTHQNSVYSGFTGEERQEMAALPDKTRLFEHLRDLPGPFRVADLAGYLRSLGLKPTPIFSRAFQAAPMCHRDLRVGLFFLAEKAGGEAFSDEDEEVLALFASQAAEAVANARAHRSEQRARADLETLVETSPIGVVVFDASSGRPLSFNREARRIVEALRLPGRTPEQLLEVVTCRRADGCEVSLSEIPIAQQLRTGETVRTEEIVLSVPDGRSVRTLVNATPILAGGEGVRSVVVTLQDLAPLDEIERMRADFLGLVGHELRAPLVSIKGSADTLLEDGEELDRAEMREFFRIIAEQAGHMRGLISDLLDEGRIRSGTLSVAPEASELAGLVERARNTFVGGGGRHAVLVDLPSDLPDVMADRRRVVQVLNNLFSNAARHAPESSPIRVAAVPEGASVAVSVSDEGGGLAPEQLPRLFRKRARSAAATGHGLGLAICKGLVEAHGGRIRARSAGPGRGATFTFTLPAAGAADGPQDHSAEDPQMASGQSEPARILAVDDDPRTLRFVRNALSKAGYAPLVTGEPQDLPHILRTERPQLVLLDLILPGTDGIELMARIPELSSLPVIFISGYGRDETVARALDAGAVDYIVKPFSPTELVARIQAALRRRQEPQPFVLGDLAIDYKRRRVTLRGNAVDLTVTEFNLLRMLSLRAGRVTPYDTLLRRIWSKRANASVNSVRVFITSLRRKLGDDAASPAYIFTERGVGYRMAKPPDR